MFKMERRQKYLEEVLKRQQRQIYKVSKELEIHREFLNLQFDSFMDFLFQNGGQIIQLSGKSGQQDETGMFFPMKRNRNSANGEGDDDEDDQNSNDGNETNDKTGDGDHQTKVEKQRVDDVGEDSLEQLPPPQAILGSPSADYADNNHEAHGSYSKLNGSRHKDLEAGRGNHSRRSSNVVSSSVAQNGEADYDDADSTGDYEPNEMAPNPEMMKYDMNQFMFSHFMDEMNGGDGGDDNGMDEQYNDDEMGEMYDGEDEMPVSSRSMAAGGRQPQWGQNNNLRNVSASMHQVSNRSIPPPPVNGAPHNERTCRYCGKTFHWKQSWVIHERTHTGEKPYLCKCGKAFSQKSNMNTHAKSCAQAMTTQKGKTTVFQMKCSHCQKMFTHKKNLDLHMEKFHPEVLNLSVKQSSSSSSPLSSQYQINNERTPDAAELAAAAVRAAENAAILQILKSHSSQVTNSLNKSLGPVSPPSMSNSALNHSSSNSNSSMSGDDRGGRYPCPYCPKKFPVKGTLERHLRVHTGEKPFLCGVCGKAFTQKGSVKLHLERVHRQTME